MTMFRWALTQHWMAFSHHSMRVWLG